MQNTTTHQKDPHGQNYKLRGPGDPAIQGKLDSKSFSNTIEAQCFIRTLEPFGYWDDVARRCGPIPANCANMEDHISDLLCSGQITLYKIKPQDKLKASAAKRTFKTNDGNRHQFTDASAEFDGDPRKLKRFSNPAEAKAYIEKLGPDQDQLKAIAESLEVSLPGNAAADSAAMTQAIATAMAAGQVMVIVEEASATPKPESTPSAEGGSNAGTTKMDSAAATIDTSETPKQANKEAKTEPEKPPCIYKKLTVTCCHDASRKVVLDPASPPKDGTIPKLEVVSCQNDKLEADGKLVMETIQVDAEIESVCSAHQTDFIKIGGDDNKLIGPQSNGKLAKFKSPSKLIKVGHGSKLLKYLWLPNIEKDGVKDYTVKIQDICDTSEFQGKSQSVRIYVYPYMKWSMEFNVNLGSIKNDNKPSANKMNFEGSLKLQQDKTKPDEFTADYKKKLAKFEDTLNNLKNIVHENIIDRFSDGRNFDIDVDLPKIALTYNTEFKEKPGSPMVGRTHEFSIEANPLLKVKASVDILPVIVKMLKGWWSKPFEVFFGWLKQAQGEIKAKTKIEAEMKFIVSIKGEGGSSLSLKKELDQPAKITGKPIQAKVEFSVEGIASLEGHIYVAKVTVVLKVAVESSLEVNLNIGKDDEENGAPYASLDFLFNGFKVFLEKEIQLTLTKDAGEDKSVIDDDIFSDASGGGHSDDGDTKKDEKGSVKDVARTKSRTWLAMSDKHEFKYYLNKKDRVVTKNKKQLEAEAEQKDKAEKDRIGEEKMQKARDENKATQDKINERIRQNKLNN